jgi:hypothetical protein
MANPFEEEDSSRYRVLIPGNKRLVPPAGGMFKARL